MCQMIVTYMMNIKPFYKNRDLEFIPISQKKTNKRLQELAVKFMKGRGRRSKQSKKRATRRRRSSKRQSRKLNKRRK